MSSWKVLVAGLVAAVVLLLAGGLAGYRLGTAGQPEWTAYRAQVDSLLGQERAAHRARIEAILDSAAADTATVHRLRIAAGRERQAGQQWRASADSLTGELAAAATAIDSLRLYPPLLAAKDSALSRETARGDSLEAGLAAAGAALGRLYAARATDSIRIGRLESQLAALPKPSRWRWKSPIGDVRPCGFAGASLDGATAGVGLCLTP